MPIAAGSTLRAHRTIGERPAVVASADAVPTRQSYEVFHQLSSQIDAQLAELNQVVETEVKAFSEMLREADVPAIVATPVGRG